MTPTKTHYRKVFKSDHLGIADLEDFIEEKIVPIFTIREVKQEIGATVAGKKGNFNIAYFVEEIKPLVLNATNSKVIKNITGSSFVEDWKGVIIELFIDPTVKMKGDVVGGVRIKPGFKTLPLLAKGTKAYDNAVNHIRGGGMFDKIQERFTLTDDIRHSISVESLL